MLKVARDDRGKTARVKLRLSVDLPRAAGRALHVLAHVRDRRFRGERQRRGINVALVTAVAAVDPTLRSRPKAPSVAKRGGRIGLTVGRRPSMLCPRHVVNH